MKKRLQLTFKDRRSLYIYYDTDKDIFYNEEGTIFKEYDQKIFKDMCHNQIKNWIREENLKKLLNED